MCFERRPLFPDWRIRSLLLLLLLLLLCFLISSSVNKTWKSYSLARIENASRQRIPNTLQVDGIVYPRIEPGRESQDSVDDDAIDLRRKQAIDHEHNPPLFVSSYAARGMFSAGDISGGRFMQRNTKS